MKFCPRPISIRDRRGRPHVPTRHAASPHPGNHPRPLFLAGAAGNLTAARLAATEMLADYHPETAAELRLAANVISFSLHALEALSQAATPDMPLNKILRLRGGAVSLSCESDKAERRLERLQNDRRNGVQPDPAQQDADPPVSPGVAKAIALIEATRPAIGINGGNGNPAWSKAHQQREAAGASRKIYAGAKPPTKPPTPPLPETHPVRVFEGLTSYSFTSLIWNTG